jgi:hypothetical protein
MKKVRLTESELISVIKKIISEQSEHVKNLYKSWANKKSGNPEKALSIMDDVLKLQKQLPKKDFAQYSSYDELFGDLNKIKQAAKSEDVTKIYEDKDLLVMAANTHEASCKYGAGSKWCTTAKDTDSYWNRHNQTGTEFFWIFKNKPQNDPNHKFSYHVKIKGDPDWCNAVNYCVGTSRLSQDSYPKQHPKYNEIISKLQEIHDARGLKEPEKEGRLGLGTLSSFISDLLEDEIMNIFDRNFLIGTINVIFDIVLDEYIGYGIEDSVYNYPGREVDDDEIVSIKPELYDNIMKIKDNLINEHLDEIYNGLIYQLAFVIGLDLLQTHRFNRERPWDQQMEEQNLTITGLTNEIKNNNPEQIDEILIEELGVIFIPIFEDKFFNLISE